MILKDHGILPNNTDFVEKIISYIDRYPLVRHLVHCATESGAELLLFISQTTLPRCMSFLAKVSPRSILKRAFARVANIGCVSTTDKYEHIHNMKTEDLFQFEPFHDSNLETFPREGEGKDPELNWSLASEWFSVWGNAFRNPQSKLLLNRLRDMRDDKSNVLCKRSYLPVSKTCSSQMEFEELSDNVKEFLSQVPNLFVEDAGLSSGRFLEVRIRSVTNDPATALAIKNILHRMPIRHPQTPHPLGLIVARGMSEDFTAIGNDPHSRALTVLVGGNPSINAIVNEIIKAVDLYYDSERGLVDVPIMTSSAQPISIKGPLTKCILPCSTITPSSSSSSPICVFGLTPSMITALSQHRDSLYCDKATVISQHGLSRVFAGVELLANQIHNLQNEMVLNNKVYRSIPGDNLLELPSQILFVDDEHAEMVLKDEKEVKEKLRRYVENEEYISFVVNKLSNCEFRTVRSESLNTLLNE